MKPTNMQDTYVYKALELVKSRLQSDDNEAWDAVDILSMTITRAQRQFHCPRCGGSHFGSSLRDGVFLRSCHSCRGNRFSWPEDDDWKYFRWVIEISMDETQERVGAASSTEKTKVIASYTHRHGADILSFKTATPIDELDETEVCKALKINWEPERGEHIDFFTVLGNLEFPDIDREEDV